jgi:hypothetical protein
MKNNAFSTVSYQMKYLKVLDQSCIAEITILDGPYMLEIYKTPVLPGDCYQLRISTFSRMMSWVIAF